MTNSKLFKARYSKISLSKRQKLINLVQNEGKTIAMAARKLAIKASTAKLIVKKFRKTGIFTVKKMPNYSKKDTRVKLGIRRKQNLDNIVVLEEEDVQKNKVQQGQNEEACEVQEQFQPFLYQIVYFLPYW